MLGYNIISNKAEYLYNNKNDRELKENLLHLKIYEDKLTSLTRQLQAFIQKTGSHFNGNPKK